MPVALPYAVGVLLVVFGSLRAVHLGLQRRREEVDEEGQVTRQKTPRYHLAVGILWVVMGLFLLISTYYQTHR